MTVYIFYILSHGTQSVKDKRKIVSRNNDRDKKTNEDEPSYLMKEREHITVPLAMCRLSYLNHLLKSGLYSLSVSTEYIRKIIARSNTEEEE